MSTIMMPFLYQTRTLSGLGWSVAKSGAHPHFKGRVCHRIFSSRTRAQQSIDRPSIPTTVSTASEGDNKQASTVATNDSQDARKVYFWQTPGPTPRGRQSPSRQLPRPSREDERESTEFLESDFKVRKFVSMTPQEKADQINFEQEAAPDKNEIYGLTERGGTRESTITIAERHAFQKIFSDIFEKSQLPNLEAEQRFNARKVRSNERTRRSAGSKLGNIMAAAIRGDGHPSQEELEAAVNQYPPALRAAAARAIGLLENKTEVDRDMSQQVHTLDIQLLESCRERERTRVETLMKAAQTDVELWTVMETEVFSLISKLGLSDAPKSEDAPIVAKPTKKHKQKMSNDIPPQKKDPVESEAIQRLEFNNHIESEYGVPPLALYGPLYPYYLLLGLRLLDRSFASPSPLALSILPKAKSLGFISRVLGASTQFYNELLRVHRYRLDDYRGIISILNEMEASALDMDHETLEIVETISLDQVGVAGGHQGQALRALWRMPEFANGTFKPWQDKISKMLAERDPEPEQPRS